MVVTLFSDLHPKLQVNTYEIHNCSLTKKELPDGHLGTTTISAAQIPAPNETDYSSSQYLSA